MMLSRRLVAPLAVSALLFGLWFGESALCSCGGPSAPAAPPSTPAEPPAAMAAAAALATAPEAPAAVPDFSDPSWTRTPSATGTYLFVWRTEPAPIPRNQDFALELWVLADGQPKQLTSLGVTAWMPEHGHGMLRQVQPEARADGSYHVDNLLLHMRGHWLLVFDALDGNLSERGEHALEL
ncbi:MAG: hypothetical protein ABL998_24545 [Planctomycetota bacterium]